MKTLLACRHAVPLSGYRGTDHDRPLGNEGVQDCEKMGRLLDSKNITPDAVLSSTAFRARSTAQLISGRLDFPIEDIVENRNWYLAPADTWLRAVQQLPETGVTACIFGHNPGMAEFSQKIQGNADYLSFPPLSIAILQFDRDYWGEVEWGTGKLIEHLTPG